MTNLRLQEAERAAKMFSGQSVLSQDKDDQFFDSKGYGTSNAALSNILKEESKAEDQKPQTQAAEIPENANWVGSDDEISLGDDDFEDSKAPEATGAVDEVAFPTEQSQQESRVNFVPPSSGTSVVLQAAKRYPLLAGI